MEKHAKTGKNQVLLLLACVLGSIIAGSSGSLFTGPKIATWYASLEKPWFTPPNWAFAPVWTTLFVLMGASLYLVIKNGITGVQERKCLYIFSIQFALNILWSFLFFWLESPVLGFVGIIFLWIAIAATINEFRKVSVAAAYLLVPYISWVTIAAMLNLGVLLLN